VAILDMFMVMPFITILQITQVWNHILLLKDGIVIRDNHAFYLLVLCRQFYR